MAGATVVRRYLFYDPRGCLVETYAAGKETKPSVYAYFSLTQPGQARDVDQFHFHRHQEDRFTVVLGRMWLLLFDVRPDSRTYGLLQVVDCRGAELKSKVKKKVLACTVTVPIGVYHGIMAPGPGHAAIVNHPTRQYDPEDEGRKPFSELPVASLGGKSFSWSLVRK